MPPFTKVIAVFGSSSITQESEDARRAYRAGQLLAEAKFKVSNGGYMGAMEACSRGVKEAGGHAIGVTCRSFTDRTPNPYLSEEVCTDDLPERIGTLMRISDGFLVLDGNIGTLAELFLVWNMSTMGQPRPIVVIGERMRQALYALKPYTEIDDRLLERLTFAPTVEEGVEWMKGYFEEKK